MYKILLLSLLLFCSELFAQSNNAIVPLPSGALTAATVNSTDQNNLNFRGGQFIINVSSYTSGTYTPHIQGKDPVSGTYYDILVGPGITGTGITIIKVYPGIVPVVNGSASDVLPQLWRVQLIGTSTPSMTISFSAQLEK